MQKVWEDESDRYSTRPDSVTVTLQRTTTPEDESSYKPVEDTNGVITAALTGDDWSAEFNDLPERDSDGNAYTYRVVENLIDSYSGAYTYDAETKSATLTNTLKVTSLSVQKIWEDEENRYSTRPDSVTVTLQRTTTPADETSYKPVQDSNGVITAALTGDDWKAEFTGLPECDSDGNAYTYRVVEAPCSGYTTAYQRTGAAVTVTNTLETVTIAGAKTWSDEGWTDKRPESITIQLLADGTLMESRTIRATEGWAWSFAGLPKYRDGEEVSYSIVETPVNGYLSELTGYNVTNTITRVTISKRDMVNGNELPGAVMQILSNGEVIAAWTTGTEPVELAGLMPDTVYTLHEVSAPAGYRTAEDTVFCLTEAGTLDATRTTTEITDGMLVVRDARIPNREVVVTPTPTPVPEYLDLRVTKQWEDLDDYDAIRPKTIIIHLQRQETNGAYETVMSIELSGEGNTWTFLFRDLLSTDEEGNLYNYRVVEEPVAGYTTTYDGFTITNVHEVVTPAPEEPTATPLPFKPADTPPPNAVGFTLRDGKWVWIDDQGVALGVVAQTGDSDNLGATLGGMLALLLAAGALTAGILKKKRKS